MNFTFESPPLQHMALLKIATTLWSQSDVRDRISKSFRAPKEIWDEVEDLVIENASQLHLPGQLKDKLLGLTVLVGSKLLSWIYLHTYSQNTVTKLPDMLFWTPHGTIDSKRIAEILVKDESLYIGNRQILACTYCLRDDVIALRKEVERSGNKIIHDAFISELSTCVECDSAIHCGKALKDCCIAFGLRGFEVVTRYLLLLEDFRHRNYLLMKLTKVLLQFGKKISGQQADVLFFLLSTMTEEQQEKVFRSHTYAILRSSLFWPWQSLFLKIAKEKWNFLSISEYYTLLYDILEKMRYKCSYYYSKLFSEFWQEAPETYKGIVSKIDGVGHLLLAIYKKEDEKNVRLILKDCSISLRKELIFDKKGENILMYLVHGVRWEAVKYLIQECLSSAEEMIEFRDHTRKYEIPPACKCQWNDFFRLLDDFILGYNKRKHMEKKNVPSKRQIAYKRCLRILNT